MKLMSRLFDPLRHVATAFFKHDVALRRDSETRHVKIVLCERGSKPGDKLSREELAARKEREELALMRAQLAELLDTLPETRSAMRHLTFVEHALGKKGIRALHKVPLDVLQHALAQFEGLVTNWSPVGLANLRSKMAVAIIDREHMDPDAEADAYRTAAVLDHGATPGDAALPDVHERGDDEALAAAYAALGNLAPFACGDDTPPAPVELVGELGSPSAKAAPRGSARPVLRHDGAAEPLALRELES